MSDSLKKFSSTLLQISAKFILWNYLCIPFWWYPKTAWFFVTWLMRKNASTVLCFVVKHAGVVKHERNVGGNTSRNWVFLHTSWVPCYLNLFFSLLDYSLTDKQAKLVISVQLLTMNMNGLHAIVLAWVTGNVQFGSNLSQCCCSKIWN